MHKSATALILFIAAYALLVLLPRRRSLVVVLAAAALVITGALSPWEAVRGVNWNVMGIFVGMHIVAELFIESRFPAYFAEVIVNRARRTSWAVLFICMMTGAISAFVDNVATVLIMAPIALSLARKLRIDPTPVMIGIAISSNLQGAATLIGDSPSMLLAGNAKMTFLDFFWYKGKPSIFFAVELGAVTSTAVLYYVFRGYRERPAAISVERVKSWAPVIVLGVLVVSLAGTSFFDKEFSFLAGTVCLAFGLFMLLWDTRLRPARIVAVVRKLDWHTSLFLMGIFIVIESLTVTGWIGRISVFFSGMVGDNILFGFVLLVTFAVLVSAFVDNIPFLAAMLPVARTMAYDLSMDPSLFLFGLLIGASLGGNITPIGASANIVACGILRREGHTVTFGQFAKVSVPFTLAAVIPAAVFIWWLWAP